MSIGDKVQLSANGERLTFLQHCKNKTGTVIWINPNGGWECIVEWNTRKYCYQRGNDIQKHMREDIKFIKN